MPVKLTPNGAGFALNPSGKGTFEAPATVPNGTIAGGSPGFDALAAPALPGAFGTIPNGTITVGYPGFAAIADPVPARNSKASRLFSFRAASMPFVVS